MIGKINEIESAAERLETSVRFLVEDRARAWAEVDRLKKTLDERELELLQLDEQLSRETKRFEEERDALVMAREDAEKCLEQVAARVQSLLPLLPEIETIETEDAPAEPENLG